MRGLNVCPNPSCRGHLGYELWTPERYRNGVPLSFTCLTCKFKTEIIIFKLTYHETKGRLNEKWEEFSRRRQASRAKNAVQCL